VVCITTGVLHCSPSAGCHPLLLYVGHGHNLEKRATPFLPIPAIDFGSHHRTGKTFRPTLAYRGFKCPAPLDTTERPPGCPPILGGRFCSVIGACVAVRRQAEVLRPLRVADSLTEFPEITPHDLKHTAGSFALSGGPNSNAVRAAGQLRTDTEKDPDQNLWSGPVICNYASRGGGIRTHDLFVPNEARYQAAPHPA
jgi:hypothetical protein